MKINGTQIQIHEMDIHKQRQCQRPSDTKYVKFTLLTKYFTKLLKELLFRQTVPRFNNLLGEEMFTRVAYIREYVITCSAVALSRM